MGRLLLVFAIWQKGKNNFWRMKIYTSKFETKGEPENQ